MLLHCIRWLKPTRLAGYFNTLCKSFGSESFSQQKGKLFSCINSYIIGYENDLTNTHNCLMLTMIQIWKLRNSFETFSGISNSNGHNRHTSSGVRSCEKKCNGMSDLFGPNVLTGPKQQQN